MQNQTKSSILKNCLFSALGLMLYGFAVYMVIQANVGVAPWDVLAFGVSNTLGIIYGNASILISLVLIVFDVIMGEKIGLGTILDAFIVGKTVDLLNWIGLFPSSTKLWVSIIMLLIAFFLEGIAQMVYMKAGLSCGPRDSFQLTLARRMPKLSMGTVNIIILAAAMILGYFLGGEIRIGTLLCPVGIGLFQNLVFKIFNFDPKSVKHQDVITSLKILFGKGR